MADDKHALVDEVRKWLRGQGQHLEFQVAERFARADFLIKQGVHIRSTADKSREVDVFALRALISEELVAGFAAVVECKYSKGKPWVVLSNPYGVLDDEDTVESVPGSAAWRRFAPDLIATSPELLDGPIIRRTARHAFGGRQVFGNNQDVVYAALQGVVAKMRDGIRELDEPDDDATTQAWVLLPVIVVDAPLAEAFWDEATQDFVIEERTSVRLHWSGSHTTDDDIAVDVVAANALDDYVQGLRAAVDPFLQQLHEVGQHRIAQDRAAAAGNTPTQTNSNPKQL